MYFQKTQIGCMVEQVKSAMLAHIPIVYIPTNQLELVNEMLFGEESSGCFVPRVCYDSCTDSIVHLSYQETTSEDNYQIGVNMNIGNMKNTPKLWVSYVSDWESVKAAAENFVKLYMDIKFSNNYNKKETVDLARKSLWIVVTPTELDIPYALEPYVYTIKVPPISDDEIEEIVLKKLEENNIPKNVLCEKKALFNEMKVSFRGFGRLRIEQMMNKLIGCQIIDFDYVIDSEVISAIRESKKQILANTPGLHWETTEPMKAAGLGIATKWIESRRVIFADPERAKEQHVDIPNGILLTGIPGSGKSLMAKTTAQILNVPLIALDMGTMRGGIVGESEHNMMNALQMAGNMAPCVLWIDEIEKAFGSSDNASVDSGVGQRLFGKFLTWMQEKTSSCFVFATSNDITKLPPELFRSERFDHKFYTFMPTAEECADIFVGIIGKQNEDYQNELSRHCKEARKTMAEGLFDKQLLDKNIWLEVLDECCSDNSDGCSLIPVAKANREEADREANKDKRFLWKNGRKPSNKLLTGADISSILKEAKFKLNSRLQASDRHFIYRRKEFVDAVKEILKTFRPYGETNLNDIVKCFHLQYKNQFEPASEESVFDFKKFDEDNAQYDVAENYAAVFKKNVKGNVYNKILFETVVGGINYYLPKMMTYENK